MKSIGQSEIPTVPWKTSDVVIGMALVAFGILVLIIIYGAIGADPDSASGIAIIAGIAYALVMLVSWSMGPARHRESLRSLGLRLPAAGSYLQILLLLVLFVGASVLFLALYKGLLSLLGWDDLLPTAQTDEIVLEGPAVIGSFALIVLWGPVAEEIFFRGFIFPGLAGRTGVGLAAVLSSLLFAISHIDPRLIVPFFPIGILLAWLYHKTGSLWSCIAAHAIWNALAFSVSVGT